MLSSASTNKSSKEVEGEIETLYLSNSTLKYVEKLIAENNILIQYHMTFQIIP